MSLSNKISLFFGFLIVNQGFHIYEVASNEQLTRGSLRYAFIVIHLIILMILLYLGWYVFRKKEKYYGAVRIIAIILLLYGVFLAIGNIYREHPIVGNFTGFIHVMITLPLLLQLSDFRKAKKNMDGDHNQHKKGPG